MNTRFRCGCAAVLLVTCLMLAGCARTGEPATTADAEPAEIQAIAGTSVNRVILTPEASSNIGIATATVLTQTTTVRVNPKRVVTTARTYVPMTAIIYDPAGKSWVYTNTAERTFIRAQVTIAQTTGQTAYLSAGPPAGTAVVTVGASELLGAEYGVGGE